jgi:hypothetical protein
VTPYHDNEAAWMSWMMAAKDRTKNRTDERRQRLAKVLRDNLVKRRNQARGREAERDRKPGKDQPRDG